MTATRAESITSQSMRLEIIETAEGVTIPVKVVPSSSRSRVSGVLDGALKVNLAVAAEKGKANRELVTLLAKVLGCSKSSLRVASGERRPRKEMSIVGMTAAQVSDKLRPHMAVE